MEISAPNLSQIVSAFIVGVPIAYLIYQIKKLSDKVDDAMLKKECKANRTDIFNKGSEQRVECLTEIKELEKKVEHKSEIHHQELRESFNSVHREIKTLINQVGILTGVIKNNG